MIKKRFFLNYGDRSNPVCSDCADNKNGKECGVKVTIADQTVYMGRKLCPMCHAKLSRFTSDRDPHFPVDDHIRNCFPKLCTFIHFRCNLCTFNCNPYRPRSHPCNKRSNPWGVQYLTLAIKVQSLVCSILKLSDQVKKLTDTILKLGGYTT